MTRKQRRQQKKGHKNVLKATGPDKEMPLPQALEMMVSAYESGDREGAYKIAGKVLGIMPDDPDIRHFAGTVALELGLHDKALEHLEKTVSLKPDHGDAWNGLGHAYLALNRIEKGIQASQKAVELLNDMPEAHYNLGNALSAAGRMDEAIAAFQSALKIRPTFPEALNNLGNIFQSLRRLDEAQNAFRLALQVDPNFKIARFNLANALMAGGRLEEAIAAYQDSIKADPKHLASYNNLATLYRLRGQLTEAADTYRRALGIDPASAELHNNLGVVLLDGGQREDAAACFKRALELSPDNAETAFNLHAAVFDDADFDPAVETLENALRIDPAHERAHFMLGTILDHLGSPGEAEAHFQALPHDTEGHHPAVDSWTYIKEKRNAKTRWFAAAADTLRYGLAEAGERGAVLDCGARPGTALRNVAAAAGQPVHGFGEIQDPPGTVTVHPGPFEETIPAFLEQSDEPIRFLHVDGGRYDAAAAVFRLLAPRIKAGTVIAIEDYLMGPNWREGPFKAFQGAVSAHGWTYEYLAFSLFAQQACVRILGV